MSPSGDALLRLKTLVGEIYDLRHAAELIEWDERVCMPSGGAPVHGEMLALLRRIAHERFTADEVGRALENLRQELDGADADSEASRLLMVTTRDFDKATKVPAEFVAEHARVISAAQHTWAEARAQSNFALFQPHLEKIVGLKRQYVTFFPPTDHPYDALLDDFEPAMKASEVKRIFAELRPRQVALIRRIAERPQVDDGFLHSEFSEADLLDFATEVATAFGFDWTRGRQDKSVHPFATSIGADDVRITTRFVAQQPFSLLFGTMHETGHGLYEQGVSAALHRTALEGGASLGVHESQSRLWENIVGRSSSFWHHFYPKLQARFPTQLGNVTVERFYQAINKVQPSLIRVEADEATYNLHVMLRVELEIGLVEGTIAVKDLPEIWTARMQDYLGVTPPDDATGMLQDIHWSAGLFGYFATYTLGNLIAAQLWETFGTIEPDRDNQIGRGEFAPLLSWLRAELHEHGRTYRPQELVTRMTGSPIDATPYLNYLETKYGAVYGM